MNWNLLYQSIDMTGTLQLIGWGLIIAIPIPLLLAIPVGALSGYASPKIAIPLGAVWSLLPGTLFFLIQHLTSSGGFLFPHLITSTTLVTVIAFAFATSAVIAALIKKHKQQKKKLAELEKQLAQLQAVPQEPQSPAPQDK
ncbi:MAG: hypothetical protein IJY89_01535 [Clostridia bacterium]|nr:hypothetical protein [Clostridia bacterium]